MTSEADSAEAFLDAAPAAVGNSGAPALRLGAYEGPLDLLLELARAQRVDLARISVATLAEQFESVVAAAIEQQAMPLPRLADWLIMAAWMTLLRSRLLLPVAAAESAEAEREAQGLRRRLADREWASRLADWLERRPLLGRQVFARGEAEPDTATIAGAGGHGGAATGLPAAAGAAAPGPGVSAAAAGAVAGAGCPGADATAAADNRGGS